MEKEQYLTEGGEQASVFQRLFNEEGLHPHRLDYT